MVHDSYGAVGPVAAGAGGRRTSWARKLAFAAAGSAALVGVAAVLAPTSSGGAQVAPRSLAFVNETTGELFCQSPCTPRLVRKDGDVAAHRDKGGTCWDLGFKEDVASAAECQQECVATDGCKMWDYRAKRSDKRCNFCSTTDAGAGETVACSLHSCVPRSALSRTTPASAVHRLVPGLGPGRVTAHPRH